MKPSFLKATDPRPSPREKAAQPPGVAKPLLRYHLVLAIVLALPALLCMTPLDPGNALGQEAIGQRSAGGVTLPVPWVGDILYYHIGREYIRTDTCLTVGPSGEQEAVSQTQPLLRPSAH